MKKTLPIIFIILLIAALGAIWKFSKKELPRPVITNFEECAKAGYPILETYPEQCRTPDGRLFTKSINSSGTEFGSSLTLRLNEELKFNDGLTVTLVEINDSRCKSGVVCVWAGELAFRFKLLGGKINQDTEIRLGTVTAKSITQGGYTVTLKEATENASTITVTKEAVQVACTMEAKLCPDGSYVGRTGPKCEFTQCPSAGSSCLKDTDCPSSKYTCQETQGSGTACPSNDPSCVPAHTVIAGECKLKGGNQCTLDSQCATGNLCHSNICTSPIGRECTGTNDTSCPADFECIQACGPPVSRQDDPLPPYYCQLKGYMRACPICLAKNTLIDTSLGSVKVQDIKVDMMVWSETRDRHRVLEPVAKISKTIVSLNHKVVDLILDDGRRLQVSPRHPTIDGRIVGELVKGGFYDGAKVVSADSVLYEFDATYDLLPAGDTGSYWANGILLGSTLH